MKKTLLAASVFAMAMGSAAFAQTTGQIQFEGEVTAAACSVEPVSAVLLGSMSTKALAASGDTSAWGSTTINFKDCNLDAAGGEVTSIDLSVVPGVAAAGQPAYWENTLGTAGEVALAIRVNGQDVTSTGTATPIEVQIGSANTASYQVQGRMVALGASTPGTVKSLVSFVANYK